MSMSIPSCMAHMAPPVPPEKIERLISVLLSEFGTSCDHNFHQTAAIPTYGVLFFPKRNSLCARKVEKKSSLS
ncbi:hypothetical protein Leryth_027624 [Lithospermum erythrorhizon]|nr:hypothetical protein Leryth_027624 [Lithospermum erythrorhizon]